MYKIVYNDTKNLVSYAYDSLPNEYIIKYKINKWVISSNNTKLFVFLTLDDVRQFLYKQCNTLYKDNNGCGFEVYKCEIGKKYNIKYIAGIVPNTNNLLKFLKYKWSHRKVPKTLIRDNVPKGTIFTDKVKLLYNIGNINQNLYPFTYTT